MLSAINLTKKFGDLLVLDDITETIEEDAVFVFIFGLHVVLHHW